MKIHLRTFLRAYGFSTVLIISIIIGSLLGIIYKKDAVVFKPFGDIFLNLLFTAIIPLVFFSISASVAGMSNLKRLSKILSAMLLVFTVTGLIASVIMIIAVELYPPATGVQINMASIANIDQFRTSEQIVKALTVADFPDILSKKNMLALIIFSILVGLSTSAIGEPGKAFARFLSSANEVMLKLISFIMYYAPLGLCAYFAYLVGAFGPELLGSYMRAMVLYYPTAILYFFLAFTFYAFVAGRENGVRRFWRNIIPASLVALATGSSMATIPANLDAADKTGVPRDISEVVIPIGATIHMEGSCLAAILKIAFLFGLFQMDFSGVETLLTAIGIALLVGVVVSGIPGGGTIGELLIISLYGFPLEVFPIITMIGTLVDAPATMLNAIGDNVASMVVARMLGGSNWLKNDQVSI
jgi:Na+/H+-dicarboxylate symporter